MKKNYMRNMRDILIKTRHSLSANSFHKCIEDYQRNCEKYAPRGKAYWKLLKVEMNKGVE